MTNSKKPFQLQFITPSDPNEAIEISQQVLKAGVRWIQLRLKEADQKVFIEVASELRKITHEFDAKLIINDSVEVCKKVDADGVHLGRQDTPVAIARAFIGASKIIGTTINNLEDLGLQKLRMCNYVGVGPFKETETKAMLSPVIGLNGIQYIQSKMNELGIHIPVIGIGGIKIIDIPEFLESELQGIAVSSAISASTDPYTYAHNMLALIDKTTSHVFTKS